MSKEEPLTFRDLLSWPSSRELERDSPSERPHLSQGTPLDRLHHHGLDLLLDVEAVVLLLRQDLRARGRRDE